MELHDYCQLVARQARASATELTRLNSALKNAWLQNAARQLRASQQRLLEANQRDVNAADGFGLTAAEVDRLRLDESRIESIAVGVEQIAELPDPCRQLIQTRQRPNGLEIRKVRVPLGVVFFIYESRPNVTADAAAICVKSGNAVILRGGKEAAHSSQAIVEIMQAAAIEEGLPQFAMQLIATSDRDAVGELLGMSEYIDLAIPRGGESLIQRVASEATMPVLKHFHGNCHVYVDASADLNMAVSIVENAKCQRMGVCNAAESLLIHRTVARELVPMLIKALNPYGIEWRIDAVVRDILARSEVTPQAVVDIEAADLDAEYLGPVLSVCVVDDVNAAIAHINRHGSGHTDAIVATDPLAIEAFAHEVDSAAVMVNASTRFNDGAEFGLGAEIGISTDKFHARGPCGLEELTTYKYVVTGNGQIRS